MRSSARRILPFLSALLFTSSALPIRNRGTPEPAVVFEHVSLIPMDRERLLPDQTVLVAGGVVRAIGPASTIAIPTEAVRVDGRGRFLMPGLVDMHVHLYDDVGLISYLAHGITTVANLNGYPGVIRWRDEVASGKRLGPTIYTTGPSINGNPPGNATFVSVETKQAARAAVAEQARAGYDMVKVYSTLSPDAYDAILDEARVRKLPVVGHIPQLVTWQGVLSRRGQTNIAHGEEFLNTATRGNPTDTTVIPAIVLAARNAGVTVTANLFAYADYLASIADLPGVLRDPEMAFASAALQSEKLPAHNRSVRSNPERFAQFLKQGHVWIGKLTAALSRAGVPILVGTDTEIFGFPGASAIAELKDLVAAGLTPYQALTAATRAPGDYVHRFVRPSDRFGVVAVEARADLILLGANPLERVDNVERLEGVMARGRWLPAARLSSLRDSVARLTARERAEGRVVDSLARAGRVAEAVARLQAMRAHRPGVLPLAEVVMQQNATGLFASDPRGALDLFSLTVETYPRSFSALSTRARAELATGDTAGAGRDLAASLALEPSSAVTVALDERLRAAHKSATYSPVGAYDLSATNAAIGSTGEGVWHAVVTVSQSGSRYRARLDADGQTTELSDVNAAGDRLWANRAVFPNELPMVSLIVRGDSVSGRVVAGFGNNRQVVGVKRR